MAIEDIPASFETRVSPPDPNQDTGREGSRFRQPGFWNAVAGMVVAIAIACGAVAMELASESSHRATWLRHRLDLMQERAAQTESRLTASNREIAELQRQGSARREFSRILSAPDGRLIRLIAVNPRYGLAGVVAIDRVSAVFEMTGLALPGPDQHYVLRWIPHRGAPITAEVAPPARGQIETVLQLPAPPFVAEKVELDLENRNTRGEMSRSLPIFRAEVYAPGRGTLSLAF